MARSEKLRQHLPSLYRPEPGTDSLLNHLLDAFGFSMDQAQELMTQIMQSHWFAYADKASFDEHAQRDRERRGLPPYNVRDVDDQLEIALYPYIEDLARHGKLVSIPPWKEPPNQKDLVENYRRRLRKIIRIYKNGLGTMDALRAMVEAELPWTLENPLPERIRSFAIEEGQSIDTITLPVEMNGIPTETVGALMRWHVSRGDALPTRPTLLIHGVAPVPNQVEATESPMIERYAPSDTGLIGIGIAYNNSLPAGQSLRLTPCRRSWICTVDGLHQSPYVSAQIKSKDPSANGPWELSTDTPVIAFDSLIRTLCGSLWMAGAQQLWRYDGSAFSRIMETESFTDIHCLFEFNKRLYIGCEDGLFTTDLYPNDGTYTRNAIAELVNTPVYQITQSGEEFWLATEIGPCRMMIASDQTISVETALVEVPTYSLLFREQEHYFGCELGLLRFDVASNRWHAYRGETEDDPQMQWQQIDITDLPDAETLGLPPIRSMAITTDQSLWLGSDEGLARYYARHERDLLYRALLEGYTDIISGVVHQLITDDRGMLWIASDQGLFRFDGRDISRFIMAEGHWLQMGRADSIYPNDLAPEPRGQWRYNRVDEQWEEFDFSAGRWNNSALALRSSVENPVSQILITESVMGELGSWDGNAFSVQSEVPPEQLIMRCKPDPQTIVNGGPPFIPALPSGASIWRYLQLEAEPVTPPDDLPWWSREGRLFPPPDINDIYPGRYRTDNLSVDGRFDESVFAYLPSAMITMVYSDPLAMAILIRLFKRTSEDAIDPAILTRVIRGINHVRPAGVPVSLAVEGKLITDSSGAPL
ncbi:hypothetical protein [Hahella ganghwensis]|uniref:hypothetical protein n=1 Tax=Hahella ganghwensis TaxID=286420 RepID=UPI00037EF43A|nr:hypothetical protein [Hahella ganghwensis]